MKGHASLEYRTPSSPSSLTSHQFFGAAASLTLPFFCARRGPFSRVGHASLLSNRCRSGAGGIGRVFLRATRSGGLWLGEVYDVVYGLQDIGLALGRHWKWAAAFGEKGVVGGNDERAEIRERLAKYSAPEHHWHVMAVALLNLCGLPLSFSLSAHSTR